MTIIRNGIVYDPAHGETAVKRSIFLKDGVIVTSSNYSDDDDNDDDEEAVIFDAEGAIVCPGFVDAHAHVMEHATPLGVSADEYCLKNGEAVDERGEGRG